MATSEQTFEVKFIPENGIVWFTFHNFTRTTIDKWEEYIRARDGKMKPPLRVVYDFRAMQGLPTPYMTNITLKVMGEIQIPEDTRTVYLVSNLMQITYYRLFARRMPNKVGEVSVLTKENDAIKWLTS